ncbi:MAG: hypothetical protein J0M07_31240 [Anaerolineae bacterium]|nr:hypothetical protein [Anaerolineae bacterium]
MDRKQLCVANVQYKKPTANEAKRAKGLLRYLTYRESRDEGARYAVGRDRWEDHGMGGSVADIAQHCEALQSQHVLLFTLVYNVNPNLIAMVAPEQREQFVRELTVQTTEAFFEQRGIDGGLEYAFVMHHRQTDDPQSPGRHDPHTHVVLPGTYYDDGLGERVPLYFNRNKQVDHIAMLHDLTEQQVAEQMERYVGPDWEQRYDDLEAARAAQLAITEQPAHGQFKTDDKAINFWVGARRADEQTSAAGYYRTVEAGGVEFRPLIGGLKPDEAELLAQLLYSEIGGDFAALRQLAEGINSMSRAERDVFFADVRQLDFSPSERDRTPDFDIDF